MADYTKIEYWPEQLVDEVMPPGRDSPEEWLTGEPPNVLLVVNPGDEDWGGGLRTIALADGDIIEFARCENFAAYGDVTLTIEASGAWSINAPMPHKATACCVLDGWQGETVAGSVEDMVQDFLQEGPDPGDYNIAFFHWDELTMCFDKATRTFRNTKGALNG